MLAYPMNNDGDLNVIGIIYGTDAIGFFQLVNMNSNKYNRNIVPHSGTPLFWNTIFKKQLYSKHANTTKVLAQLKPGR